MPNMAYIGIGSNLGDPLENCRRSIALLDNPPETKVLTSSSFYKTEPVGEEDQDWFINAVAQIATELEPEDLLDSLLQIETAMGRIREEKWGPRIIDLDLLLYEDRVLNSDALQVPHPEMTHRCFVLMPLCELAADQAHPTAGKTIRELLAELPEGKQVHRVST